MVIEELKKEYLGEIISLDKKITKLSKEIDEAKKEIKGKRECLGKEITLIGLGGDRKELNDLKDDIGFYIKLAISSYKAIKEEVPEVINQICKKYDIKYDWRPCSPNGGWLPGVDSPI